MTASSVEFFPCRVQLMGLPRSVAISAVATNILNPTAPLQSGTTRCPPSLAKVQKASRNLFGAPDPVEINNMYQLEAKRQRSYVLQRYSFDIKTSKPTDKQMSQKPTESLNITDATSQPTQLPTLIEQELEQHEQRLQKEECNLKGASSEKTPYNNTNISIASNGLKVMRSCSFDEALSTLHSTASERHKPYARQSLLTESFNLRMKSSTIKSHRNLQAIQLSHAIPAAQEQSCYLNKEDENVSTTTNDNRKDEDYNDDTNNISSCSNCSNSSTYSLKVVVSSQNSSSASCSSASNAHTHHA